MPTLIRDDVCRILPEERSFLFEGVGGCVCFRGRTSRRVVVYSLTENSWSWLPSCPRSVFGYIAWSSWMYSFEPMSDMKVR